MKLLVRLLRQVRQGHAHPVEIDMSSTITRTQDRSSMADFVRILRAQDRNLAAEAARYRATMNAAAERNSLASFEDKASD
jgi:hypothetical protein